MARILVVDDEISILSLIKTSLEKDGHVVSAEISAKTVLQKKLDLYDLILLDIMMPEIDGFSLCSQIRDLVDCPILFLTAKNEEKDILYGLELGADDFLVKPFRIAELRARVNAHLRRESREPQKILSVGDIRFDLLGRNMKINEIDAALTKGEYDICEFLARNHGRIFTKEQIYESVFGFDAEGDSSTVATHIKNIRAKLSKTDIQPIETIWGVGYKWK